MMPAAPAHPLKIPRAAVRRVRASLSALAA
jgi:hypothetical protein